jgi:drug/metabolite transporter (DMT)-like permease
MTAAFQHSEAARVGSIIYTEVVLALLWGYMFFSETITNGTIVGIVIILTSALLCSNIGKTRKAVTLSAGKH